MPAVQDKSSFTSCPDDASCDAIITFLIVPSTMDDWFQPNTISLWYTTECALRTSSLQVSATMGLVIM